MRVSMSVTPVLLTLIILVSACTGTPSVELSVTTTLEPTGTPEPTVIVELTVTPVATPTNLPLERPPSLESSRVRNVILFIGDGMGENHRTAATWISQGQGGRLAMDSLDYVGWSMTRTAWDQVTDSAAGATALATGVKTANYRIGIDTRGEHLTTILEHAQDLGMATGLITTVQITHATPAAFVANTQSRDSEIEIAEQIIDSGVNVLLGGGENYFLPEGTEGCFAGSGVRKDGRNLINEAIEDGYQYVCDAQEFLSLDPTSTTHLLGLFADEELLREFLPSLREMTSLAISILDQDPDGFFLMVEGGQIDWASHAWNAVDAMGDTLGMDKAVAVAMEFTSQERNTLIIVTADHETGGMTLETLAEGATGGGNEFEMPDGTVFKIRWSTSSHTDADVPVTAQGPGAELIEGTFENTHIYEVMRTALWLP